MPLLVHPTAEVPAYVICTSERPTQKGKGGTAYRNAIQAEAKKKINTPITTSDIAVEVIYSTEHPSPHRKDIDNAVKPTLDALEGFAFKNDAQVRSVTGTLIDRTSEQVMSGRVEYVGKLMAGPNVVLIAIYSNSRLKELGGAQVVEQKRMEEYLNRPTP